ncbi:MlaD family protein [Pseudoxanthobacter sp.]|uniref:PqiB family protein n=1 Tax=Pseudoxanthobacter sp. TaxID=1925742 RepID=UPI002FE30E4C
MNTPRDPHSLPPEDAGPAPIGQPTIRRNRRISMVWIIPIVTALIAAFLGWRTLSQQGPLITISFSDADGIEAGKTPVKYKNVQLGTVQTVALGEDMRHVVVTARMDRNADHVLTSHARFWVVKPRASITQISGLDTLLSGAYIAVDPGAPGGEERHKFQGLPQPPIVQSDVPGTAFVVTASRLGSLSPGSPVFFRDFTVGQVLGYDPSDMGDHVSIHVFVRAPYDRYVRDATNFWNASGFAVQLGAEGVSFELESLEAVLAGGIAFDTPEALRETAQAKAGTEFKLYQDQAAAIASGYHRRLRYVSYFEGSSVRGLGAGSPVQIYGITIGTVTNVTLQYDKENNVFRVPVNYELEPGRIGLSDDQLSDPALRKAIGDMVGKGMRTQLRSANLLTGQQVLALDFFPQAKKAGIRVVAGEEIIPSVPPQIDSISRAATDIMDKIARLPLDQIADNLNGSLEGANTLLNSPDLRKSLDALAGAMTQMQSVMKQLDTQITPALQQLPQIATGLNKAVVQINTLVGSVDKGYGAGSRFKRELDRMIGEFTDSARSVRVVADLLSAHPEALILGRTGKGNQ